MTTLIVATRNRHKVQEIRAVLGEQFRYRDLADLPETPLVVEDGETFAANATKKAVELAAWLGEAEGSRIDQPALVVADDSGLEVDALGGAPGVHSARFAALNRGLSGNSSDAANNAKLLGLLRDVPEEERSARFRCVIAVVPVVPTVVEAGSFGRVELFEGVCEGRVLFAPRGQGGFGYDPLFQPLGESASFAALGPEVKNRISHRARALQKLAAWLQGA